MTTTPEVRTCFWYDHDGLEAAEVYCSLIPDSELTHVNYAGADVPHSGEGRVLDVGFRLGDQRFLALNGGPMFPKTEAASIMLYIDTQKELDRLWDGLLADGGHESQCGWLSDRFGLWWQVVPRRFAELMASADTDARDRVINKMLTMTKLDIEPLEEAARG